MKTSNHATTAIAPVLQQLFRKLVVSCQARAGEPFRDPESQARFAVSAVNGGAAGIRAQGADDVRAIRREVAVPIIGIRKVLQDDGRMLITPTFESACELVDAGAEMIAIDVTARGQRKGAIERVRRIKTELKVPVLADIATLDEALAAAEAGADAVLSTMRGYTDDTADIHAFDCAFVGELARLSPVPVLAEGMIQTPEQARAALDVGAYAVIVGSAITRPVTIARRFVSAIEDLQKGDSPA